MESSEANEQHQRDVAHLASLGYKQQLTRGLNLWSNFAIGFTYLSPLVGVYALFSYGLGMGGPAMIWTMPIVIAGQFLVVLTFSEVASQYPLAGGIYQWAKRLVGERYAWLAGWMYTWALLITIASVAFSANPYASQLFGYTNNTASTIIAALVIIALGAVVNLTGVRRLAVVANIGFIAEIFGTIVFGAWFLIHGTHHGLGVLFHSYGAGGDNYLGAFLAAALFSVWIFYGFEACGDVAEEVKDPSRKVPRAMRMTLLMGGGVSAFVTLSFILATPNFQDVISGKNPDPIGTVFANNLGSFGTKVALVFVLTAFISCTLAIQAAASRLVFSYARDGMIVGHRSLSRVSPRFHMPPGAVAVAVVIPALICFLPSATIARIITFSVVGIYVGFQSVVLASLIGRSKGWKPAGAFTLKGWGPVVNVAALIYGVSTMVILSIKTPPSGPGFFNRWLVPISVGIVFLVGLLYLLILRPEPKVREDAQADAMEHEMAMREEILTERPLFPGGDETNS
ncbi:MAG TPA: APC family permease [Acidimicrobiales bacterium]|nr:APC family permease [Acidimicrobiales bacterium]